MWCGSRRVVHHGYMERARRVTGWSMGLAALMLVTGVALAPLATAESETLYGFDVSWPQCSVADGGYDLPMPPADADFMIIGLTKGLAFTENPCLASQVAFSRTNGIPAHGYAMATFPTADQLATYGSAGPFDPATRAGRLRNVGFNEAAFALDSLAEVGWDPPTVWIDVEPRAAQPWPAGTATAEAENKLVIEGLMRGLHDADLSYGLYSYSNAWKEITGGWSLPGVPVWATAGRLDYPEEARDRCSQASFSGGEVHLAQWTDGTRDFNLTCGTYRFSPPPLRVFGPDRFATSVAASRQAFPAGAEAVFLATGADFADALAAGPAAAGADGPVLLVRQDTVPDVVAAEIRRLDPDTVHLLGGSSAIGQAVERALDADWDIVRIAGSDRYSTAAAVADRFWESSKTVFLAVGAEFPDALAGGSAAAGVGAPMLLTRKDGLPPATAAQLVALDPDRVVVLGGTTAIADGVVRAVVAAVPGVLVERVSGSDRYATSLEVVRKFWPTGSNQAFVATGTAFPDALSAVPLAAVNDSPVVLSRPTCAPAVTTRALDHLGADLRLLMGGKAALATFVLDTTCPG